jgi:hypothetical protein
MRIKLESERHSTSLLRAEIEVMQKKEQTLFEELKSIKNDKDKMHG